MQDRRSDTYPLHRRDVVKRILEANDDLLVIAGLGSTAWDITSAGDRDLNFPLWGPMAALSPPCSPRSSVSTMPTLRVLRASLWSRSVSSSSSSSSVLSVALRVSISSGMGRGSAI